VQENDPAWDALVGQPWAGAKNEPDPLPSAERVDDWRRILRRTPAAVAYLRARGLSASTCRDARLGFDGTAITIPVYSAAGDVVNVKRRFLDPTADPKTLSLRGRGAQLYPDIPSAGRLLLFEGEFDVLIARQHGVLGAFTGTIGMGWLGNGAWDWAIRDRAVAIVYDAGRPAYLKAKAQAANLLRRGASDTWVVNLAAAGLKPNDDVSDWFVKYGRSAADLRRLIRRERRSAWR
jgi:hypothetical protein